MHTYYAKIHVYSGLAFALAAVSLSSSVSLAAGLYTNRLLGVSIKAGVMMTVYEQVAQ